VVGETLARGFAKHGYETTIGTREPANLAEFARAAAAAGTAVKVGTFEQPARFGEILVLA